MNAPETRELEPSFYEALGRVAVTWGFVEAMLVEFLASLAEIDPGLLTMLTQDLANATIVKWIRSVVRLRFEWQGDEDYLANELLNLLTQIDDMRAQRNKFIHGLWGTRGCSPGTALVQTVRWTRSDVIEDELVTLADLHEFTDDISEIAAALIRIGEATGFHKPSDKFSA